jgi:hypothetical protein
MTSSVELPGLERLIDLCHQQKLGLKTLPPDRTAPETGTLVQGLPFDPVLAAVYHRLGYAVFAAEAHADLALRRYDNTAKQLVEDNQWWSERLREQLALPTFIIAVEPMTAYRYATVPALSDAEGRQPVVLVDPYEDPYALPVASNVDRFFEAYSRYLEVLLALPNGREEGASLLSFPWEVPDIIGRDGQLVELIHQGRFDSLMVNTEALGWSRKVVNAGLSRM